MEIELRTMPVPPNGSETVKSDADLMFRPAYEAAGHQVFFGRDGRLKSIANLENGNIIDPGLLEPGQTYLWRVDATHADGTKTEGKLWSFTVRTDRN